tara:strand:+ start:257 stop:391 length:135 start_codon:yes stop_codon:yes gene_type:complete
MFDISIELSTSPSVGSEGLFCSPTLVSTEYPAPLMGLDVSYYLL